MTSTAEQGPVRAPEDIVIRDPLIDPFSPFAHRADLSLGAPVAKSVKRPESQPFAAFATRLERDWRGHKTGDFVQILSLSDWYEATGLISIPPGDEDRVTAAYPPPEE